MISFGSITIALLAAAVTFAEDPPVDDAVRAPLPARSLVAQLNSDDYAVRESATNLLGSAGVEAVEPLATAAAGGDLEVAVRALSALESLYVRSFQQDDVATVDAVETALEQLSTEKSGSIARRAAVITALHYEIREQRALAQLTSLGAVVGWRDEPQAAGAPEPQQPYIVLGKSWKGGDEGLAHVRRLADRKIDLYICRNKSYAPASDEALARLLAEMPKITGHYRGLAHLGVQGGSSGIQPGGLITQVMPGKAAALAGLQKDDLVQKVDGKPLETFDALVNYLIEKSPGDKVEMEIVRRNEVLTVPVTLGAWTPE